MKSSTTATTVTAIYALLVAVATPRLLVTAECFNSTQDILLAQAGGKKDIVICPGTTITIGVPTDATFSTFAGGDYPLSVLGDDTTIKCGDDGSSSNNCVLEGGFIQFATTPALAQAPGLAITTNNLMVQGLTFKGQLQDLPIGGEASVGLSAPGMNMVMDDVIFDGISGNAVLFLEKNAITPPEAFPPMSASLTIQNSVFRNIMYTTEVVSNGNQTLTLNNVAFEDIKYVPCSECPDIIATIVYGQGKTELKDCQFNNVEFTNSAVFIRGVESDLTYSGNTGMGLTAVNTENTCEDGLIVASSPIGTLDLSSDMDVCKMLLESSDTGTNSDSPNGGSKDAAYGVGTFVSSLLCVIVATMAVAVSA